MAYTNPTADTLQAAFPRFAAVDDAVVEFWLTRARRQVDASWTEDDYQMGQMLLAAHYMVLEGLGTGAEAAAGAAGAAGYKRMKSASLELERFDNGSSGGTALAATTYGQQWLALARSNRGGPRVMGTGALPTTNPEVA